MTIDTALLEQKCQPQTTALAQADVDTLLPLLEGWKQIGPQPNGSGSAQDKSCIVKTYAFKDYHETLAFINAIACLIHAEDHHPELVVTYNRCVVKFDTHSVDAGRGGLSINDFICAAKVDAICQQSFG